jgi:hypothetical protein
VRALFLVVWLPLTAAAAFVVWRTAVRRLRSHAAAGVAAAIAAAGLLGFPEAARDAAASARRFEQHRRAQDDYAGGPRECLTNNLNRCVRARVMDEVASLIPEDERYYVDSRSGLIRFWAFTALLPRVAVASPSEAEWILSYRSDPAALPVRVRKVRTIAPVFANGARSLVVSRVVE